MTKETKYKYYGGGAAINVYSVPNVGPNELSGSLIWIINKSAGATLRAGWEVRPSTMHIHIHFLSFN